MKDREKIEFLKTLAKTVAGEFGSDCEVVVHDLTGDPDSTIVAIENGHVTSRKVGDGPSQVVLEAIKSPDRVEDHIGYLTHTEDGKVLKSATAFLRDEDGTISSVFSINFNITPLMAGQSAVNSLIGSQQEEEPSELIATNVSDLLDNLIDQAIRLTGKPVAIMDKSDKARAVNFLNDAGALLITKSSERICQALDISKYALYNFLNP